MISIYLYVWLSFLFGGEPEEVVEPGHRITFGLGETIEYKVHYGFVNAANARMVISDKVHYMNGKPCYKMDVFGESIGMFDLFLRIRDNWGTYFDTSQVVPKRFYRHIEEGKYRKNEIVDFNHRLGQAKVREYSFSLKKSILFREKPRIW